MRSGDGATDGGGVEIGDAGSGDVKRAGLQRGDAFADKRPAAVDEAGLFSAVFEGLARNIVVVGLVGLAEIRRVGVGDRLPFCFIQCSAAEVSRPPEKAMPTFWPSGRDSRITDIFVSLNLCECVRS